MVLGTVGYMAPEQVRAQAVDHRADIFSLGTLLYEMLSGRRAFQGDTTADTMTAILEETPPELADERPRHSARARSRRHPLPRKESGAAIPVGERSGVRAAVAVDRLTRGKQSGNRRRARRAANVACAANRGRACGGNRVLARSLSQFGARLVRRARRSAFVSASRWPTESASTISRAPRSLPMAVCSR